MMWGRSLDILPVEWFSILNVFLVSVIFLLCRYFSIRSVFMVLLMPGFLAHGLVSGMYFFKPEMLFYTPILIGAMGCVIALNSKKSRTSKGVVLGFLAGAWALATYCIYLHYGYLFLSLLSLSVVTYYLGNYIASAIFCSFRRILLLTVLYGLLVALVSLVLGAYSQKDSFLILLSNIARSFTENYGFLWLLVMGFYYYLLKLFVEHLCPLSPRKPNIMKLVQLCFVLGSGAIFLDKPGLWLGLLCFHTMLMTIILTVLPDELQPNQPLIIETSKSSVLQPLVARNYAFTIFVMSNIFFTAPAVFNENAIKDSHNILGFLIKNIVDEEKIEKWHHEKVDPWIHDI